MDENEDDRFDDLSTDETGILIAGLELFRNSSGDKHLIAKLKSLNEKL